MKRRALRAILVASVAATATPMALAVQCLDSNGVPDPAIFSQAGSKWTLQQSCTTDKTIEIPNGFRFDGNLKTITAVDPSGDHFRGAVVLKKGGTAQVYNLTIDTAGLADNCDTGADRLRGILFDGASGVITRNKILNITQGPDSLCNGIDFQAEGNGIEVRNSPFDGTHPSTKTVDIRSNRVQNYQKTGIVVNGDVRAIVSENTVLGPDPTSTTPANGIQIGFGAFGTVRSNTIRTASFFPTTIGTPLDPKAASGVLVTEAGKGSAILENVITDSDVGVWFIQTSNGVIRSNRVTVPTLTPGLVGIALDDFDLGSVMNTQVVGNFVFDNDIGIGLFGSGAALNSIISNTTTKNETGIFAGLGANRNTFSGNISSSNVGDGATIVGDSNIIRRGIYDENGKNGLVVNGQSNSVLGIFARGNTLLDIENTGNNTYGSNICYKSSGPPVDCGTVPPPLAGRSTTLTAKSLSPEVNVSTTPVLFAPAPFM